MTLLPSEFKKAPLLINFPGGGFPALGQDAVYILMGAVRKMIDFVSNVSEIVPFW